MVDSDNDVPLPAVSMGEEAMRRGGVCPCCGQVVKLYRRAFRRGHFPALKALYALHVEHGWYQAFTLRQILTDAHAGARDMPLLRFWGLLEPQGAGRWRLTPGGRDFVRGFLRVPRYALTYNNQCFGHEGELVRIDTPLEGDA